MAAQSNTSEEWPGGHAKIVLSLPNAGRTSRCGTGQSFERGAALGALALNHRSYDLHRSDARPTLTKAYARALLCANRAQRMHAALTRFVPPSRHMPQGGYESGGLHLGSQPTPRQLPG